MKSQSEVAFTEKLVLIISEKKTKQMKYSFAQ